MSTIDQEVSQCLKVLTSGGTILYPTDTIWGIGCDATNAGAVMKIYRLKKRMENKSLIILLDDTSKLPNYTEEVPDVAWDLLRNVDTPLTIIYPKAKNLAANVSAGDGSVAIRIVRNEFCKRLIQSFGKPIVSTSANPSGIGPPLLYRHIDKGIIHGVDYAVDSSLDEIHSPKPSRIIKLETTGEFHIIRK
jgi:L-threonylcarbamoyladenylate synthase